MKQKLEIQAKPKNYDIDCNYCFVLNIDFERREALIQGTQGVKLCQTFNFDDLNFQILLKINDDTTELAEVVFPAGGIKFFE